MIPVDLSAPPPASVVVSVPEVLTTASDGLPRVLRAGRLRLVLPVFATTNATARATWIEVGATECGPVALHPGQAVRTTCSAVLRGGRQVTVRVLSDHGVVASWRHAVR